MLYISRRVDFCASHRLFNPTLSDEENARIYGCCTNPNGHGHNYTVEVIVKGQPDPMTGMIMDLKELKDLIKAEIVDRVDHKHLNVDVEFLEGVIPTTENLALAFWQILETRLPEGVRLHEIKVWETENNMAFYRGEPAELVRHHAAAGAGTARG